MIFIEAPSLGTIAVTKIQTALTSLIAVIPALFLAYLLVMAMLSFSENLTTLAYIVLGGTLIASIATILIPAGVMFVGGRKPELAKVAVVEQPSQASEDIETIDDDVEVSDSGSRRGSSGSFDAQSVLLESSEIDIGDSDQDMLEGDSESLIETEPVEDLGDFDLEEEESPKPKKKKR